jgi:hydrogenase maturation factor HypE
VLFKETTVGHTFALYADGTGGPAVHAQTTADVIITGNTPLPVQAWTHLAATYDGSALRLYVNGVAVNSTPLSGAMVTSAGPLRIGGNTIWGDYFAGVIDEVRVYYRALTPAEIQRDMTTPIR